MYKHGNLPSNYYLIELYLELTTIIKDTSFYGTLFLQQRSAIAGCWTVGLWSKAPLDSVLASVSLLDDSWGLQCSIFTALAIQSNLDLVACQLNRAGSVFVHIPPAEVQAES